MAAYIFQHGVVHDMAFMSLCLKDQADQRLLAMHMDTVLWSIGRSLYKDYPIEPYQKMLEAGSQPQDTRTGREIIDDLAEKFRARIAKRGGQK